MRTFDPCWNQTVTRGAAVIVASKPSTRENSIDLYLPAMLSVGDVSFIESLIIRLRLAGAMPVVVVTGFQNDVLERHLSRMGVIVLHNTKWDETSVGEDAVLGLDYVVQSCAACRKIWVATSRTPNVEVRTLIDLLEEDRDALVPTFEGREGEPVVITREMLPVFEQRLKEGHGRDLFDLLPPDTARFPVQDKGVEPTLSDDAGGTLPGAADDADSMPFRVHQKLSIARDKPFFGPGGATLLRLIDRYGNVRKACHHMNLSYSKGWKIINFLEKQLGTAVITRKAGGPEGGNSQLTDRGRDLLYAYECLVVASQMHLNELFRQIFTPFLQDVRIEKKTPCDDKTSS